MRIRFGYDMTYETPKPTPMIGLLNIHHSLVAQLEAPDAVHVEPFVPINSYHDSFGNFCVRLVAPAGYIRFRADAVIHVSGAIDPVGLDAVEHPIADLPDETIQYLLGSRYCETDLLSNEAWGLFEHVPAGWTRVQAICDHVHERLRFDYLDCDPTRTAAQAARKGAGVCRDFAHLAIAFCRCMNIPARYCTGYISDVGLPPPYEDQDFCAWMEVYLGGRWWAFDPRNNGPRVGRILMARGRDAADVPLVHSFGPHVLRQFKVWVDHLPD
ncbi:MAG TPA: transglutaminase family protein [Rhodoblastus sp.]|nr:transglutaminase family protein [Rhodoblastus sp.]